MQGLGWKCAECSQSQPGTRKADLQQVGERNSPGADVGRQCVEMRGMLKGTTKFGTFAEVNRAGQGQKRIAKDTEMRPGRAH